MLKNGFIKTKEISLVEKSYYLLELPMYGSDHLKSLKVTD